MTVRTATPSASISEARAWRGSCTRMGRISARRHSMAPAAHANPGTHAPVDGRARADDPTEADETTDAHDPTDANNPTEDQV
ncbi:hypothetical protein ACFU9X_46235 [Streptomyces atratus]|uniref:hypothetical protein n=1 Tax=Streptomyces atratus TaxID=1893 RepID=UPI00369A1527